MKPIVSIIITTKNRKNDLLDCLESVLKSTFKYFEIIIIDDASTDGTEKLESHDFDIVDVKIFHQKEPLMMVKARNFGAQKANGKYVLFIDDDNIIDKEMIKCLVSAAENNPEYGIFGPSMYYHETKEKYMNSQCVNLFTGRTKGLIDISKKEIVDSDGIPNVFMIKKCVFEEFGYFDEDLIQSFTEPDFAFSVRGKYKAGIVKTAKTYHKIRPGKSARSMGAMFHQKAYCLMRNRSILIARYGSFAQKMIYLVCFSWFWPLAYSILMLRERQFRLIKLYAHGFKDGMIYFFTKKFVNSLPKLL